MPQYISDEGDNGFSIEVCSGNTLQDMLVFDNIRSDAWLHILKRVMKQYLIAFDTCENACEATSDPHYMFHWNITQRFNQSERQGISIPHSAKVFLDETYMLLAKRMHYVGMYNVIHGDFHFGNIFYDASCDKVKAIDPRGNWDGRQTTSGYMLYDFAKLLQSVYAGYAWVVSGVPVNEKLRTELTEHIKTFMHPLVFDLAKRYALLLQLSAIPLHYDNPDRQRRMLETSMKYILEQHPL
jgi:5-methylthioribose kinase